MDKYQKSAVGVFMLLLTFALLYPEWIYGAYKNSAGRVALLALVVWLAHCNLVLGLIAALCIVVSLSRYGSLTLEGMTVGDDAANAAASEGGEGGLTPEQKIRLVTATSAAATARREARRDERGADSASAPALPKATATGDTSQISVDKINIEEAVKAKRPNSIPVDRTAATSSADAAPATEGMLGSGKQWSVENFCSSCASAF